MNEQVLKLDVGGRPVAWVTREAAALLYCRDQVAWEAGEHDIVMLGGMNRVTGRRSKLRINSIVATRSLDRSADAWAVTPALTNRRLFRRDNHLCLYCGESFSDRLLTRDHVVPISAGGTDDWENVVTACRPCNQRKDNHRLEDLGWSLLAVPYVPNRAEGLILENRRILGDQMAFLKSRVGSQSRIRDVG